MLKLGEIETIADYQARFVYSPKPVSKPNPLYYVDHATYLKVVGKI